MPLHWRLRVLTTGLPGKSLLIFYCKHNRYSLKKVGRRRQWHPTPVPLPGESHGRRSLAGYSPWGCGELDTTERLHFQFSLSCIGEGNGNPLQCSCLENPRDADPGGLPSMGSHGVGHDWSDLAAVAAAAESWKNKAKHKEGSKSPTLLIFWYVCWNKLLTFWYVCWKISPLYREKYKF